MDAASVSFQSFVSSPLDSELIPRCEMWGCACQGCRSASARHRHQTNLVGHRQQDRVGAFIAWFDIEQPHKAFDTKCHAESLHGLATLLRRVTRTDLSVPRSRRIVACGSRGLRHKRINTSTVLAGQTLAIKKADDGFGARASCALIWHASIWNRKPCDPFGTKLSPMS
jgi:hypothetical protein